MLRLPILLSTFLIFLGSISCFSQANETVFRNGQAVFVLQDHLKHPYYWWPKTLVEYPVKWKEAVKADRLILWHEETNQVVPFQLSTPEPVADGWVAKISFLSDLPSGGKHTFVLKHGSSKPSPSAVSVTTQGNTIRIQTNRLAIEIPASQPISTQTPGPIQRLSSDGSHWMGESVMQTGKKKLVKLRTSEVASGPLFVAYRVEYDFADGSTYKATVRCIDGYEFVELTEEMEGVTPEDSVAWRLDWNNFAPTHRQAPNHPYGQSTDSPGFARYDWETIDQNMLSSHHGILYGNADSGKIPFEVGDYAPWPAETTVTLSTFWNERQSVGVFVKDAALWNDGAYAIWHGSRLLNVKFHYKNGLLSWTYPVAGSSRQTGLSLYNHQQDIEYMNQLEVAHNFKKNSSFSSNSARISQLSYTSFLQNRYGTLDLNKVKDWVLNYPTTATLPPVIFETGEIKTVNQLEQRFLYDSYTLELPFSGPRQNSGYGPVPARSFYEHWLDAYNRLLPTMNPTDRERFAAMFLLHAYVAADEEYMPMKNMLSGHPNFLADVKSIPAMAAFLFPDHPEAHNWADLFEKYVEFNTRYHSRPDVASWDAQGGRWTENLGAYTWAFLRPTMRVNYLLQEHFDGKNRVAGPKPANIATWILNSLSAPYDGESLDFYKNEKGKLDKHSWGVVTKEAGPRRVYSAQGAHALRRQPPSVFWALGQSLEKYDPLLSEHIRFVSHPDDQDMEALSSESSVFSLIMYPKTGYDLGTPPDFKTIKLTGFGTILRAGVGTPQELSIHLTQIDQGPNYRWGRAAEGGSGVIYFYAAGKSYSHNGKEDIGDRRIQDTDLMTNFGVFKDGTFKSVGQNTLHRPLYSMGVGQFTEIVPSQTTGYSWPEYQSRSIMLVGQDYFITYDDVYNKNIGGRFSWFTHPDEELPTIEIIKAGGTEDRNKVMKTELKGSESKGVWYDGTDDFMVFISHKKGYDIIPTPFGCKIQSPKKQQDFIFRNDTPVQYKEDGILFNGTAGFIRNLPDKTVELALFHGKQIGAQKFSIETTDSDVGMSAHVLGRDNVQGEYYSMQPASVVFRWEGGIPPGVKFYLDGREQKPSTKEEYKVSFPAGHHSWQLSTNYPIPPRPTIMATEYDHSKVLLSLDPVPGADRYQLETSTDNGKTWKINTESAKPSFFIKGSKGQKKIHARVTAFNPDFASSPSPAYPIYFTSQKPENPDGLKLKLLPQNRVMLNWGQVLGSPTYSLYRRLRGKDTYQLIYTGNQRSYTDESLVLGNVYEYAVTARNKNGESAKSYPVQNDPTSWLLWEPRPDEPFRRAETSVLMKDNSNMPVEVYYPE